MQVPFAKPHFTGREGALVADVIASGWVSQGPKVREFERAFAARVGAAEAVATTSCTTALQLALHVDWILERRRMLAERYNEALAPIPTLYAPHDPAYPAVRTWQSYCVRVDGRSPVGRTELMRRLLHDGIPPRRGVMTIHEEAAYADARVELPHSEAATRDVLMLPLFADLTEEQQDYVLDRLAAHAVAAAA